MAFADGTQAHEESNAPRRHTFLNQGRHDRRIEECDRLDGIFHREAGTDEQLLSLAQTRVDRDGGPDLFEVLFKDLVKIGMVGAEGPLELGQAFFDLAARERSGPAR